MITILFLVLFSTYFLPLLFITSLRLDKLKKRILFCHFLYPAFSEGVFVFGAGHSSLLFFADDYKIEYIQQYYAFAIMCRLTILASYYIFFKLVSRKRYLTLLLIKRNFNYKKILFICIVLFLVWLVASQGIALYNPRLAYQLYRNGNGFIWAFFVSVVTYLGATLALSSKGSELYRNRLVIIIFEIFNFLTGSKGVLLWNNILSMVILGRKNIANIFLVRQLRSGIATIIGILIPLIFTLFILFGGAGEQGLTSKIANYANSTQLAANYFELLDSSDEYSDGEIIFTGFWSFVPRSLFPQKPYAYGQMLMNEKMFPGLAETGHTPSLGMFTRFYADFGWFGFPLVFVDFKLILSLISLKVVLTSDFIKNSFHTFLIFYMTFPMITFHIPVFMTLTLYSLFLIPLTSWVQADYDNGIVR